MKKNGFLIIILLVVIVLTGCSSRDEETVAVLDMNKVLDESEHAQELYQELMEIGSDLEDEYQQKKDDESQSDDEGELNQISDKYLDNKSRLEEGLNQEIHDVIEEISEKEQIEIVLYKESSYYGGLDITDKVIQLLDNDEDGEEGGQ
ncbi:MAG: hypothetical protein ACOCRZ_00010 [Halothermotrichaceae bacterium]